MEPAVEHEWRSSPPETRAFFDRFARRVVVFPESIKLLVYFVELLVLEGNKVLTLTRPLFDEFVQLCLPARYEFLLLLLPFFIRVSKQSPDMEVQVVANDHGLVAVGTENHVSNHEIPHRLHMGV